MIRPHTWIAAVLACALIACSSGPDGFELEITPQRIQTQLNQAFPRESCQAVLVCVKAHTPQLALVNGSQRLGLRVALSSRSPVLNSAEAQVGTAALSAKLRYERTEAALYLDDVKVDELQLRNAPEAVNTLVRELSPLLMSQAFAAKPIYTIPSDRLTSGLQRMVLQSVQVKNGKVVAVVRMPGT